MSEKKTASEAAAKKRAKKKSAKKDKKETNSADVRKRVSTMVKSKAMAMTKSVMGETQKGVTKDMQLATVKYLFEVASIYPPQRDQEAATDEEDSLAKTLLRRLNIPEEPIRRDEDEDAKADSADKASTKPAQGDSEGHNAGATEKGEEGEKPALV
jgi:hypothetical protein